MFGLVIDTVTPGRAPPLASVARPVIPLVAACANAAVAVSADTSVARASRTTQFLVHLISLSLSSKGSNRRGKRSTHTQIDQHRRGER
jgi:hypothetical protein